MACAYNTLNLNAFIHAKFKSLVKTNAINNDTTFLLFTRM